MSNIEKAINKIINADCLKVLKFLENESVDSLVTDPPYGMNFMNKDWDKVLPSIAIWRECFRILKPGSFAFVMTSPRLDLQYRMAQRLEYVGFNIGFTPIYWAYASGFPKATNISKAIDKQSCKQALTNMLGREPTKEEFKKAWEEYRETYFRSTHYSDSNCWGTPHKNSDGSYQGTSYHFNVEDINAGNGMRKYTRPKTLEAKALDGSYAGFQPKPAVEVVIVAMKPLSEENYIKQALHNRKGITWLDDCRVPVKKSEKSKTIPKTTKRKSRKGGEFKNSGFKNEYNEIAEADERGRFPANLLVSDDILNDGKITKDRKRMSENSGRKNEFFKGVDAIASQRGYEDSGSFSRYFNLDNWFEEKIKELPKSVQKTFPFLIVPKPSKTEKDKGVDKTLKKDVVFLNYHPTVKPVELMSYLIILGSRKNDIVIDPFVGSGTTSVAAIQNRRKYIGIEISKEFARIAIDRVNYEKKRMSRRLGRK